MKIHSSILVQFHRWRLLHLKEQNFVLLRSVVIGLITDMAASLLENRICLGLRLEKDSESKPIPRISYFAFPDMRSVPVGYDNISQKGSSFFAQLNDKQ